jgi:type IV pilus assembly protein PilW
MSSFRHLLTLTNRQTQNGLSLVELMISITIGLLILSALTTLFVNQSKTRSELDKSNRMIDNGRYALEVLSENLRMAGFYGNYLPSGAPAAAPDPCSLATITDPGTSLDVLRHHVQGYTVEAQANQIASLPASCGFTYTAGSTTSLKPGSDILVLRRVSTATPVAAASAVASPNSANTVYLQVSNCNTDAGYQLVSGAGPFAAFHDKDCTTIASLRPFIVQAYFVSPDNNPGDGIPTLKRQELDQATGAFVTTPLVEGIEYLQVDYGLDADTDGAADSYIANPAAANWPNIVSVKLNIIARNIETSAGHTDTKSYVLGSAGTFGPFGDHYKRHAYTQVVRLINPSGRREVP